MKNLWVFVHYLFVTLSTSLLCPPSFVHKKWLLNLRLYEFSSSLAEVGDDREIFRYFFPNHQGGEFLPSSSTRKQQTLDYRYDLPELEELDNIHSPRGSLHQSLQSCAKVFGSKKSWYLVNGSSGGICTAILALKSLWLYRGATEVTRTSSPIFLIDRNAHKSVFDGLTLANTGAIVLPVLIDQNFQVPLGIDILELEAALKESKERICGVIITRPTYQGAFLAKEEFASVVEKIHRYNIPVLVDEAHGAHLKFLEDGQDALGCGADVVVQSGHKSLMSLSQTALLHLNKNISNVVRLRDDVVESIFHSFFSMLTTTSPNFLLLSSLDASVNFFGKGKGVTELSQAIDTITRFKKRFRNKASVGQLLEDSNTILSHRYKVDPLKLNVRFEFPNQRDGNVQINAAAVDEYLCDEFKIYCELNLPHCVTYVLPPIINRQARTSLRFLFDRLGEISSNSTQLQEFLTSLSFESLLPRSRRSYLIPQSELQSLTPARINIDDLPDVPSHWLFSASTISLYPPGIPLLLRGERLQDDHLQLLRRLRDLVVRKLLPTGVFLTGTNSAFSLDLYQNSSASISSWAVKQYKQNK